MRIPRFYIAAALVNGQSLSLPDETAHYAANVLRMAQDDSIVLFNGDGHEYAATITSISRKQTTVHITGQRTTHSESPLHTVLAVAVSKGERMDWIIQKCTELGVTEIQPVISERTEVRLSNDRSDKKLEHWRKVAISACEQSQRTCIPHIYTPVSLGTWLSETESKAASSVRLILHTAITEPIALKEISTPTRVVLLSGPEGGFSAEEFAAVSRSGFQPVSLGSRVLRTETAPVAMLTLVQFLWGDMVTR